MLKTSCIILQKIINRISVLCRNLYRIVPISKVSLFGLKSLKSKADFVDRLQEILGGRDINEILRTIKSSERDVIMKNAKDALNHNYDILGTGKFNCYPLIWNKDFKSGYEWPALFYVDLRKQTPAGVDIKIPWEFSRCHHLLWLGEAYILDGNEVYAKEIVENIDDWIEKNPVMYSVNWTCAMDVAIRAVNWMYALLFIRNSTFFTDEFATKVYQSLFQHAFFIRSNLERQIPLSNNHYVSDLVGLLYLSILFENNLKGKLWKSLALKQFYREIRAQILPSGVHYEKSVSYHRLMLELNSYTLLLLERNKIPIPEDVKALISKMYEFSARYTKENGFAPMIGDNDDGRFLPFVKRDFREHAYLNDMNSTENIIVNNGCETKYICTHLSGQIFENSGFGIFKTNDVYLFLTNGGFSKSPNESQIAIPTHTHNDLLSFELALFGCDFIVDPGTFLYTSSTIDRNQFRSTSKHNTIVVDDEEQNRLHSKNMFLVSRNVIIDKILLGVNFIEGSYRTLSGNMLHQRKILCKENKVLIIDRLNKPGNKHKAKVYFHFAEDITPKLVDGGVLIYIKDKLVSMKASFCDFVEIIDDTISPSFGILKNTKTVVFHYSFDNNIEIKTDIIW